MNHRRFAWPLLAGLSLLLAGRAIADVPPPYTSTCLNRNAGDACDLVAYPMPVDGSIPRGTCGWTTCSRPDYANWDRDASASPPSMQYMCLMCMPSNDGGAVDGATTSSDAGGANTKTSGSGCAIAEVPRRDLGPWLLAGAFGAAVLFARRRR